jgi:hypothetical protein
MPVSTILGVAFGPDGDCEGEGERGERGKRGKRGHRGHDGLDGSTGPTGPDGLTGPTGPTGTAGVVDVIAAGTAFGAGTFINQSGFTPPIVHVGPGHYTLTLTNPPALNSQIVVSVAQIGTAGEIAWTATNPTIDVFTFDSTGAPADRDFSIVVFSL